MVVIGGLQKTSLVDFPGKVVAVVFTLGCNFKCPFCHNGFLVEGKEEVISQEDFFGFLEKRRGVLDGVCISGGEPMIQTDIFEFVKKIKKMGFVVKLDTNGTRPEGLRNLIDAGLLDYVAMDFKNRFNDYANTVGLREVDTGKIQESIRTLKNSKVEYEMRTTIVPGLHCEESLIEAAEELKNLAGGKVAWYWQSFRPVGCLDETYCLKKAYEEGEIRKWLTEVKKIIKNVYLR